MPGGFFSDELQLDAAAKSYLFEHDIDAKGGEPLKTEDIVFILCGGDVRKYKDVLQLTRGEALHWMLMMAKSTKKGKK